MVRVRILAVVAVLAGATLALGAVPAAAGGGGGPCVGFTRSAVITVEDYCFQGTAVLVDEGTKVTVVNQGQSEHDFTAVDGSFASGTLEPGERYELVVDRTGAIPFYCTLHGSPQGGGMSGVLFVGDSRHATAPTGAGAASVVSARAADSTGPPAATTAVSNDAATYLAAGALLLSTLALVVIVPLVRRPRRGSTGA